MNAIYYVILTRDSSEFLPNTRSYLHGSVGPFQSLLGNTELKRTLTDGQLKVFIGTWNMNGKVCGYFINSAKSALKNSKHYPETFQSFI